jgi:hypothetical protein
MENNKINYGCMYCKSEQDIHEKLAFYMNSKPIYWKVCAKCEKERYMKTFKELNK